MKYTIVTGRDASKVAETVMNLLGEGWYLQGGSVIDDGCFAQALIKPTTMGDLERPEFRRESVYVREIGVDKRGQT